MGKRGRARARVAKDSTDLAPPDDLGEEITGQPTPEPGETEEPPGLLVALALDADLAAQLALDGDGALDVTELHLTLAYCPYDGTADQGPRIARAVGQWAAQTMPVWGRITGGAVLVGDPEEPTQAVVALVDSYSLLTTRASLCRHLTGAGVYPSEDHSFLPHITLAYLPVTGMATVPMPPPLEVEFDYAAVAVGQGPDATVTHFALLGPAIVDSDEAMAPVMRSDEARYTLAPLYVPDADDTHGEHVIADDLQKAAWDYFRSGDRDVFLQHLPDVVAGEVVELVTWPFPVEAVLRTGDGTERDVTIPAGTVYEGVVWADWAYEAVKAGKLNGLSFGGAAVRVPVPAPAA